MRSARVLVALLTATALTACGGDDPGPGGGGFPSESVRLLVPYTAGGPTDIAARALAAHMEEELGESVVVENLPGASGATAYQQLIQEEADGHTLSMTALPTAVLNYLTNDIGYTREDFTPIGVVTRVPSGIVVPADSPHQDLASLFGAAQDEPGSVTVGTPGATNTHAAEARRITQLYDVPLTVVPFDGNSEVQTALLGGNVTAGFLNLSQDVLPAVESGDLRVLAVGSEEPLPYVDAPTFVDEGYPELVQSTTTFGVVAPAGLPDDVRQTLEDTLRSAAEEASVVETLDERYVPEEFIDGEGLAELFTETEETFRGVLDG
ncbi:tripartite tricarboxylate transporter substrate binding protein [Blastococcus sp. BMG 814]|uniref:Tripartite tricarboxylate transporter substrate binding protein n=1 Tax=Blastococcus carthaginiensis TaxID=3050034 RepID=A0ABT9IGM7_9ACTN|nr:tripartite tricarboxylate transporter substrate binding protein [Blastococcus carthaginiensis]MDP5184723.1 tripartite tricarboxylate transporter substrate binding protein [Blastococcus carthaginiensis]